MDKDFEKQEETEIQEEGLQPETAEAADAQENTAEDVQEPTEAGQEEALQEPTEAEPMEEEAEPAAAEIEMKEEKPAAKDSGKNVLSIIVGLLIFAGVLAFCWNVAGNAHRSADVGVLYAKDNEMHFFDLKNEPYLLAKSISDGGSYHYYYSAWGATLSEEGDWAAYAADIDENGIFDLYRKDTKDPKTEPEKISEDVLDYGTSKDGQKIAYLKADGGDISLWLFDGESRKVTGGMALEEQAYLLSGDGKSLLYAVPQTDAYTLYALSTEAGAEPVEVSDAINMYALAEETDTVYYVAQSEAGEGYAVYSYALADGETECVAENIAYMEVMPNGRDLLYCRTAEGKVLYKDLIEDDMAEADAALPAEATEAEIAKNPELADKLERDKIRQAMQDGEGFAPVLMDCYILTNGQTVKAAENVISAVAVANDRPFVTGYQVEQPLPIRISELTGADLQAVEYAYYGALAYGGQKAFLADAMGHCWELPLVQGDAVAADTVQLSKDGSKTAYFVSNSETGVNDLVLADVQKIAEAQLLQTNADSMAFLGGSNTLGYYCNYSNGVGTVATSEGDAQGNACGVYFAESENAIYFISEPNSVTGNGTLKRWDGKKETVIAENTFAFQYKANGKLTYLQNYDVATGLGNLYYYDGKQPRLLDTDVTALFMY